MIIDFLLWEGSFTLMQIIERVRVYNEIGKLAAKAKDLPLKELYQTYQIFLMESLYLKTSPKKNANVLELMMGYFKEPLSSEEKKELLGVIDHYWQESIPLIVPITLIRYYVRK